jgi:hypothetical protein
MDDESLLWAQAKQLPKGGKDLPMTVEKKNFSHCW